MTEQRPALRNHLRAWGAIAALTCAAAAQFLLERARVLQSPPPAASALLFLAGAGLTVAVTRAHREWCAGARPLAIEVPRWGWLLACAPGLFCLAVATAVARPGAPNRTILLWWCSGIALLLATGVAHALWARGGAVAARGAEWSRARLAVSYALLIAVGLAFRLAGGLQVLPAFVESDEAYTLIEARGTLGNDPYKWFGVWWIGVPNIALVLTRAAQLVFGDTLWGGRMGGVVLGTVAVVAAFAFARRLIGNLPALTAALLTASAHALVHWSRNGQIFIQTPMAAAVILWMLVRVWTGGGLLSWIGAGVALGVGAQTYQASQLFPVLVGLTAAGWAAIARTARRGALLSTALIFAIALLAAGPLIRSMLRAAELIGSRPSVLFAFSAATREQYGDEFPSWLVEHMGQTLTMFNTGGDFYPAYWAHRSLVDVVTAALIPLAAVFVLSRLWTATGWLCATWWSGYLLVAVFLANHPPTYHRVATALLFASVAVAWTLVELLAAIRDGFHLSHRFVAAGCGAFALLAVAANAHYYFSEFRAQRPIQHTLGLALLTCPYAGTHVVIDATILDGIEYVPPINPAWDILCPELARVRVARASDLWKVPPAAQSDRAVLVVPAAVAEAHPGRPEGYRVARQFVDRRIGFPEPLPLAVYELERERPASAASAQGDTP